MYIYESHLGGFYESDELYYDDSLYCEQCGDSDTYVGFATTRSQAIVVMKGYFTSGEGYDQFYEDYIMEFVNSLNFDNM